MNKWEKKFMLVAGAVSMFAATSAWAEEDTIVTDRPDFVESSLTVGKNRFQIETSIAFEKTPEGATKQYVRNTPTLLRYGVSDNVEIRLESDARMRVSTVDGGAVERQKGWADAAVGLKWHTHDGEGASPAIAWLFHADIDSGSAAFRGREIRPSVRAVFEWGLPNEWGLGVMPGLVRDKDDAGRFTAGILGVVLGKGLSERLRVFFEVAGHQLASASHGGNVVTYDAGLAYLLTKTTQLDFAIAAGANDRSPDFGATIGLSMKF